MAYYFFPSCKATAQFKEASKTAREYANQKFGIKPIGCCRPNHKKLTAEDTAIVVCNNCAAIIEENTDAEIEFLWQVIDQDPDFPFPDYHGEEMTVQDCWVAFEKRDVQDTIRSLLRKMNIRPVELEENYEKTKFCGVNLLSPCTESNAALAHKRYVEQFLADPKSGPCPFFKPGDTFLLRRNTCPLREFPIHLSAYNINAKLQKYSRFVFCVHNKQPFPTISVIRIILS